MCRFNFMKLVLVSFLITVSLYTKAQNTNVDCKPDTSRIAILPFSNHLVRLFDSTYRSLILIKEDYCSFQKILVAFFNDLSYSPLQLRYSDYRIQYIPVIDTTNKRLVLINGLCKNDERFNGESWKTTWVRTADGGSCYFMGIISLSEKKIINFWVNREARIKKLNSEQNDAVCDATIAK